MFGKFAILDIGERGDCFVQAEVPVKTMRMPYKDVKLCMAAREVSNSCQRTIIDLEGMDHEDRIWL